MIVVSVTEAKNIFSELLNRVVYGNEVVIVTSRGRQKAAIISIQALRSLEKLESESADKQCS